MGEPKARNRVDDLLMRIGHHSGHRAKAAVEVSGKHNRAVPRGADALQSVSPGGNLAERWFAAPIQIPNAVFGARIRVESNVVERHRTSSSDQIALLGTWEVRSERGCWVNQPRQRKQQSTKLGKRSERLPNGNWWQQNRNGRTTNRRHSCAY